jgi:sortase A
LRNVTPGMQIYTSTKAGVFLYLVDSTEIVLPESVDVLDIRSRPELILITCYPFDFLGAAPKRFVVHAHLVSVAPETLTSSASSAGK